MKVHVIQKDVNNRDLRPFLDQAGEAGADLICFGELATSGCLYTAREIETFEHWKRLFAAYPLRVMCGLPRRRRKDGALTNSFAYFHRDEHQVYDKINLFPAMNEDQVYTPGDSPGIFNTDLGKLGVAICYDIRFPDLFMNLKQAGAEILFIPAAFPRVRIDDWKQLLAQRAHETTLPVIGVNCVGDDGTNSFGGSSMVVATDGTVVIAADETSETVLRFDLENVFAHE